MPKERFSKATLGSYVWRRILRLEKQWSFDPRNGWAQVEHRPAEANRAYGQYAALRTMAAEFVLPYPEVKA